MAALHSDELFWAFFAIQVLGLLSAALARFAEDRRAQAPCQGIFLAAMSVVALVTVASLMMGGHAWIFPAATLAIMIVLAVWDPGVKSARPSGIG